MRKIRSYVEIEPPGYLKDWPDGNGGFMIPVVMFRKTTNHADGSQTHEQMTVGMTANQVFELVQEIKAKRSKDSE
jgi:hypothetical protein